MQSEGLNKLKCCQVGNVWQRGKVGRDKSLVLSTTATGTNGPDGNINKTRSSQVMSAIGEGKNLRYIYFVRKRRLRHFPLLDP